MYVFRVQDLTICIKFHKVSDMNWQNFNPKIMIFNNSYNVFIINSLTVELLQFVCVFFNLSSVDKVLQLSCTG